MKKMLTLLVCLLLFGYTATMGQDMQLSGTVTSSEDGSPIPGAYVKIKGENKGTTTDVNGKFQLLVPAESTLEFSSIGFVTQEIPVAGQTVINVALQVDVTEVEDVIVVGYQTIRKEANTGAVNVVKSSALKDVPAVSVDKILGGKVPGVSITSTTGQPNAASQISIRGITSISSGTEPLIVIDGTAVMIGDQSIFMNTSNALSTLNPNDIDNISILKDASAASIYGSRAANGVILITTKSGKIGKSQVNFRVSYGVSRFANDNNYGVMSGPQLLNFMRDAATNAGLNPDVSAPSTLIQGTMTDWMDEVTRDGQQQNYELSYTGGTEMSKFYISGSYMKDEGVFYGIDFTKYQVRVNVDQKLNNWLSGGVRINGGYTNANDMAMQSLYYANPMFAGQIIPPWIKPWNDDGTPNLNIPVNGYTNPLATAKYDDQWEKQNRLLGSVFFEAKLFKGLTFKTTNSYELTDGEGRRYWSAEADWSGEATLQTSNTKYTRLTSSNTLTYNKTLGDKHFFTLLAGQEAVKNDYQYYYLYSPYVNPEIPFPNTSTSEDDDADYEESTSTMLSYFGVFNYEYNRKYFLSLSLRTDGSSRFGSSTKWGTFYSVGLSWVLTNESFLSSIRQLNLLKLRANYGINGNDQIGDYDQWGLYEPIQYNSVSGMAPKSLENPNLTWELNKSFDAGVDFEVFKRLSGTFEVYKRKTVDQLLETPLSRTTGLSSIQANVGTVENKGYEVQLNVKIFEGQIKWDVGGNIAHNLSEIKSLSAGQTQIINKDNSLIVHKVGERLLSFYLYDYAGVNPVNGEALWYDSDGKITNQYSSARRIVAGSPEPKFTGGFNSSVSWKGLTLSVAFEFKTGNKIVISENRYLNSDGYSWGRNHAITQLDYWKEPGDVTRNPKPIANNATSSSAGTSTRWMQDGDYMRIKDITLSYSLPSNLVNKAKMQGVRIYASAFNLYTFHNVDFWDPERGLTGSGSGIYPQTKKIMFGVELSL
jgi:TonB-dependent starch-binding outer membrane protein SusC